MYGRHWRELRYHLHNLYSSQEGGKVRLRLEEGIKFSIRRLLEYHRFFGFHEWWQFLD